MRYLKPGWFARTVFNPAVALLTRAGLSIWGSRILEVTGRTTGALRKTPVNVLTHEGSRYLVAPRGETQWVRNVRASRSAVLRLGRRREAVQAIELSDEDKPEVLRAYLKRWKAEVGVFFGGVGPRASDQQLLDIAPNHPVFRIEPGERR